MHVSMPRVVISLPVQHSTRTLGSKFVKIYLVLLWSIEILHTKLVLCYEDFGCLELLSKLHKKIQKYGV